MHRNQHSRVSGRLILGLALAVPGAAFAYNEKDAIRDCESRIRSEYKFTDLRDARAERLMDVGHHYRVQGVAKVDGKKHPWNCEVKERHVTMAEYDGPKPEGLGTAEKLAIGAAAAIAAGVALNEASKHGGENHTSSEGDYAPGLQDLIGARGSSGESELQNRGFTYVSGSKGGGSSYTNWRKGSHCITVRTVDGRYKSIIDAPMADCESDGHQSESHAGEFADGLSGGPDYWEVTGVSRGDTLNVRAGPSSHETVLDEVDNGTVLRNLGCRMSGGHRWCRVAPLGGSGASGWVAGSYLRESAYQP